MPWAIWWIKDKIVEILYLLLSSAQNYQGDKWITSLNMPGLCPGPFDELKIKVLKFFTSCWVQRKITQETSGLDWLKFPACAPQAIQPIKNKIVDVLYLLLSSAQNRRGDKCITSLNMPGFCPRPFNKLKIKMSKFFTSCWVRHKITGQTSALHRLTCPACTRAIQQIKNKNVEVLSLLLSLAQNRRGDKWITSLNTPGFCPRPFNELKIKLVKFFTSCWVRRKLTKETSALHCLTCQASAPGDSMN